MNQLRIREATVSKSSVTMVNQYDDIQGNEFKRKEAKPKVASYCRVSSEEELQLGSLENQIIHYTNYIRSNPNWQYAGVYSDKGKSGTDMSKRTGFNRMIRNAMNGEIDIIICKSISRFARNVVDTMDIVRQLTERGINVIFEKERLSTKDVSSSLLIKILATFAEEESRSTSENIEWALTKQFERGEVVAGQLFGYEINKDKEWVIIESEARIVREAYELFLKGKNMTEIDRLFIRKGYKKRSGDIDWDSSNIRGFLTNERYSGDVLSRKTCTFREASLNRLRDLKGSDKAIKNILEISFMRAWVIHIKVESPFLFTIKWIDGQETVVGKLKGGLIDDSK